MSANAVLNELGVSRETGERLEAYVALLEKWNRSINLVAPHSLKDVWQRHIVDSAQLLQFVRPETRAWLDLGSGGGLPGIVIAILAAEAYSDLHVSMVESDQRKCVFLREAARVCGIDVDIYADRVEAIDTKADIVSARALAPLPKLLDFTAHRLHEGGFCLFPKGVNADAELTDARRIWQFHVEQFPSLSSPDGVILRISDIERLEATGL